LAETEWNLSLTAIHEQKTNLARHHGEQALAIARELGHPQLLARCLNSLSMVNSQLRRWETAEVYANEARQLYTAAGNQVLAADSQRMAGMDQLYCGRPRDSLATLQETLAFSQQIENLWGEADCAWKLALTRLELGHYGQAITLAGQGVEKARKVGLPMMDMLALSAWGTVQRTILALDSAREILLEVLVESTGKGIIGYITDWALSELCALHALSGDWSQAHDYARQVSQARGDEFLLPVGLTGWYETEALLRGGESELARAGVERLGEIVGRNRRYRLILSRSQAVLAYWDGDLEQAITHLQAALALAWDISLPGEEWSILSVLAGLYAEQGEQDQARRAYQTSAAIIRRLAETIDEEELRSGFLAAGPVRCILESSQPG
jgi:tetratricopeptide (TPR) repeat protein